MIHSHILRTDATLSHRIHIVTASDPSFLFIRHRSSKLINRFFTENRYLCHPITHIALFRFISLIRRTVPLLGDIRGKVINSISSFCNTAVVATNCKFECSLGRIVDCSLRNAFEWMVDDTSIHRWLMDGADLRLTDMLMQTDDC